MNKKFLHNTEIISSEAGRSGLTLKNITNGELKDQNITLIAHDNATGEVVRANLEAIKNGVVTGTTNEITNEKLVVKTTVNNVESQTDLTEAVTEKATEIANSVIDTNLANFKNKNEDTFVSSVDNGHKIGVHTNIAGNAVEVKETITELTEFSIEGNNVTLKITNEAGTIQTKTISLSGIVTNDVNIKDAQLTENNTVLIITETDETQHSIDLSKFVISAEDDGQGTVTIKQGGTAITSLKDASKVSAKRQVKVLDLTANQEQQFTADFTADKYIIQTYDADGNAVSLDTKQVGTTIFVTSTLSGQFTVIVL